jgi:hypothetical protein
LGYRAVYRNQSFKKSPKYGVIGVKSSLQKSFIQKKHKIRGHRDKSQFTAIIHSKKSTTYGIIGVKSSSPQSIIQNNPKRRDKSQFTAIIHSTKAQKKG